MTTENTTPSRPSVSIEIPPAGHREKAEEIVAQCRRGLIPQDEAFRALAQLSQESFTAVMSRIGHLSDTLGTLAALREWQEASLDLMLQVYQPAAQG